VKLKLLIFVDHLPLIGIENILKVRFFMNEFFSIGYPMVTLGFGFKTYLAYKWRLVRIGMFAFLLLLFLFEIEKTT
jgi:hypothetical protein